MPYTMKRFLHHDSDSDASSSDSDSTDDCGGNMYEPAALSLIGPASIIHPLRDFDLGAGHGVPAECRPMFGNASWAKLADWRDMYLGHDFAVYVVKPRCYFKRKGQPVRQYVITLWTREGKPFSTRKTYLKRRHRSEHPYDGDANDTLIDATHAMFLSERCHERTLVSIFGWGRRGTHSQSRYRYCTFWGPDGVAYTIHNGQESGNGVHGPIKVWTRNHVSAPWTVYAVEGIGERGIDCPESSVVIYFHGADFVGVQWLLNGVLHRDDDAPCTVTYCLQEWRKHGRLRRGNGLPVAVTGYGGVKWTTSSRVMHAVDDDNDDNDDSTDGLDCGWWRFDGLSSPDFEVDPTAFYSPDEMKTATGLVAETVAADATSARLQQYHGRPEDGRVLCIDRRVVQYATQCRLPGTAWAAIRLAWLHAVVRTAATLQTSAKPAP